MKEKESDASRDGRRKAGTRKKKRFLSYVLPHRGAFVAGFASLVVVTASRLAGPLILRALIDNAIPRHDVPLMLRYSFAYLALIVFMAVLSYFQVMLIVKLGLKVVTGIKRDLFAHLLSLPVSYFDAHPVGELMARVENDTEKVKQLFSESGIMLAANAVYFVGMLAFFFFTDFRSAIFIVLPFPFFLAAFLFVFGKLRVLYERSRRKYAEITAVATEFVQGMDVVQAFDRTERAAKKLETVSFDKRQAEIKASLIEYSFEGFMFFLAGPVLIAFIIKLVAPGIFTGFLTVGTLLVFIEYGMRIMEPFISIGENIRGIQQSRVALDRIFAIFETGAEPAGSGVKPSFEREIEFRNVGFSYKKDEPVLDDVSFTIRKGETVALVGPSGSGKTTAVSLLCRFYRADKGVILSDGVPIDNMDLPGWRRKIGLVLQDIYLFPGSILENVRVYDEGVTEGEALSALRTVEAADFIGRLPQGISTELAERGSNLSMGEKQLVSFARAVAFGADIVIMDEATASVDVATERRIQESMARLLSGRTAVIVAHRLSSILKADRILFFKDGRIVAQGRHEELFAALPEYEELVRLQFPDLGNARKTGAHA